MSKAKKMLQFLLAIDKYENLILVDLLYITVYL